MAAVNVSDRTLQLLKVVILARLLSPQAFGLLGIALLAINALERFSELGFDQALIQHQDENIDTHLNTAWVVKIVRGFVIAAIAYVAAPQLATLFGEPQATSLIQGLGFYPLILGFQNPAVVYFQKNLNFHREFVYQVGGRMVDLFVAVVIAIVYESFWALAGGIIAMTLVKFILSYVLHDYRPKIEFDREYASEMFGFGKWMFASGVLAFLYGQGDDLFVGWLFSASVLGFYQIGYRFSNAPATEVTHLISRVAFPTFSKVQDDISRLRTGYFRVLQLTSVISFPMAAGIAAISFQFVNVVFGSQWAPMAPLIQILALWGGIRSFGANVGAVFNAVGKPNYGVLLQVIKVVTIAIIIYPAAQLYGVVGVAYAIIGSALIVQPISIYYVLSIIEAELRELVRIVVYPLTASIVMFGVVFGVDHYLFSQIGYLQLSALIILGIITYVSLMVLAENRTGYEFLSLYVNIREAL